MSQGCWGWFLRNVLCLDYERVPSHVCTDVPLCLAVLLSRLLLWLLRYYPARNRSRVICVQSEKQFQSILEQERTNGSVVLVDFSATWCRPCRALSPIFHELSVKYPCMVFVKVDVDQLRAVAKACGVTTLPSFQFFRRGIKCDEMRGEADQSGLETRIHTHYVKMKRPHAQETAAMAPATAGANGWHERSAHVITVTSEAQWQQLLRQTHEANKVLVVAFWAPWCMPCVEMAPFFETVSRRFPAFVFARVNVDEVETGTDDVSLLPCFRVLKNGRTVDEVSGAFRSAVESMVARHCG
ncbi:hypothetical protein PsorP6_012587 [Peronosclerospora sorghi]|uniref:Uncharacterized protein n=1 Tax=Peronosclerospora sorghi TaxID=230839 RepID=A0ACC0WHR8_9STRA|nr:hypothetical protein PsorP6_012587 [Peronosclerospora sorghi]